MWQLECVWVDEASRNYLCCCKWVSLRSLCRTYPASMCHVRQMYICEKGVCILVLKPSASEAGLQSTTTPVTRTVVRETKLKARFGPFNPTQWRLTVSMPLSYCQCLVLIWEGETRRMRGLSLELQGSVFYFLINILLIFIIILFIYLYYFIYLVFNWNICSVYWEDLYLVKSFW